MDGQWLLFVPTISKEHFELLIGFCILLTRLKKEKIKISSSYNSKAPGMSRKFARGPFFIVMKNTPKNRTGLIGIFGLFSLIALEYHISPDQHWAIFLPIAFAGIGRFYLFYEGATMEEAQDRLIAFRLSLGLSFAFMAYVVVLFINNAGNAKFELYHLALFLIASLTLLAVEWVFGRRSGYARKNAIKIREYQSSRLIRLARTYRNTIQEFKSRIGSLESELNGVRVNVVNLENKISTLESQHDLSYLYDTWLRDEGGRFRVSRCCGVKSYVKSNRQQSLCCSNCGNEIWKTEPQKL